MARDTGSRGETKLLKVGGRQSTNLGPSHRKVDNYSCSFDAGKEEDWLGARNFCRQRCMDLVSVETSPENEWIKQRLVDGKVRLVD